MPVSLPEAPLLICGRSFMQLATRYPEMISESFGGYAAGSGAAGLIGSFMYTLATTSFGARPEAVISLVGLAPTVMLLQYFCLLPSPTATSKTPDGESPDFLAAAGARP